MRINIDSINSWTEMWKNFSLLAFIALSFAITLNAKASDLSHIQLKRNTTLEIANIDKTLLQASNKKTDLHSMKRLDNAKITNKSKELEGVFISNMLEPMFPSGKESNLFGGGNAQNVFRSMMIQEYGKIFAEAGGVGLAKSIEKQVVKQQ